jgi:hypothetical protein
MKRACPRCYDAMAKKGKALSREADQQMRDGLVGRARQAEPQGWPRSPRLLSPRSAGRALRLPCGPAFHTR